MKQTLSYVMVTPYSISKSRTGGVISRLLSRVDLELVGAQLFTPDEKFVREYADAIWSQNPGNVNRGAELLSDYVMKYLSPSGGRKHRILLLVFKGEDPCHKLTNICGVLFPENRNLIESVEDFHGETIRDTYADLIVSPEDPEKIIYFEPAVLTPRKQKFADEDFELFAKYLKGSDSIVQNITYPDPSKIEKTLVIIKPDNWKYASSRPGTILDMFSKTGLRIVGIKVHRFTMAEALDFYGPVEENLIDKLSPLFGQKAREVLENEFKISLNSNIEKALTESFGIEYAREQFRMIIEFMSGTKPNAFPQHRMNSQGDVMCMILVYEGEDAIKKIRDVLGPTDPLKAPGGTIRREFGSNIMINTAHASDSRESFEREKKIVKVNENSLYDLIITYLKLKS